MPPTTTITAASIRRGNSAARSVSAEDEARSQPLKVPKTAEIVADHIRQMILRGELAPGDFLRPEAQLIKQFATSRATIREAFRILEAEHFLTTSRGSRSGAQVHVPDAAHPAKYAGFVLQAQGTTISDVYVVRAAIEPYAVWLLAKRRAPQDVAALKAVLAYAELLQASGDHAEFRKALNGFHRSLVDLTGSNSLRLVIAMVHDFIERHRSRAAPATGPELEACHSLKSFWKLIRLIQAGDAERAQSHWREHIRTTTELWLADHADAKMVDLAD